MTADNASAPDFAEYTPNPSNPTYAYGACPSCHRAVPIDQDAATGDDSRYECPFCTTGTGRLGLILQALREIDLVTWSLFASNFFISASPQLNLNEPKIYNVVGSDAIPKWLHTETRPNAASGERYQCSITVSWPYVIANLLDSQPAGTSSPEPAGPAPPPVQSLPVACEWYAFGISDQQAVPGWRQSLFGGVGLGDTNPPAAVVLFAAAFESFFTETMRIAWRDQGFEPDKFERLVGERPQPITGLIDWLPGVVGAPDLKGAPDHLYSDWASSVNRRRNDVVHRADVQVTAQEALRSLEVTLRCIAFLDRLAFVKPHAYYTSTAAADSAPSE